MKKQYVLLNSKGEPYLSTVPGEFDGHNKLKIYGKLDCPNANRWIKKGKYKQFRVFFLNEDTAKQAGYRPCSVCMRQSYLEWKKHIKIGKRIE